MKRTAFALVLWLVPIVALSDGVGPWVRKGSSAQGLFSPSACKFQFLAADDNPTSVAKAACKGSLYCRTGSSGGTCYTKSDDGSSTNWVALQSSAGAGDVVGPGSATDNAIALFNGTGGKTIKNSSVTVSGSTITGALSGNASTATALAANPTDCSANQYANAIAASGDLTCAQVSSTEVTEGTKLFFPNVANRLVMYEDFLSNSISNSGWGWLTALKAGANFNPGTGVSSHPGIGTVSFANGSVGDRGGVIGAPTSIVIGADAITYTIWVNFQTLATVSDDYVFFCGLSDNTNGDGNNALEWRYSRTTDTHWEAVSRQGAGSETKTTTATTVSTSTWYKLSMTLNAAGTSAVYALNGSTVGTHTTNLPNAAIGPVCYARRTAGTTNSVNIFDLDAYYLQIDFGAAR